MYLDYYFNIDFSTIFIIDKIYLYMFLKNPKKIHLYVKIMISPKVYEKQIQELGIEGMIIAIENEDDASILLEKLDRIEKILEKIRHNIRIDIRNLRRDYMEKMKEIKETKEPSKVMGLYKKQRSVKDKIKEKRNLIDERDLRIAAYESIEYTIDEYLIQIKDAKSYVSRFSK